MLEALGDVDPLEAGAILSMTFLVHGVIKSMPEVTQKIEANDMIFIATPIPFLAKSINKKIAGVGEALAQDELKTIAVSYAIAFMVVKHGGEIFKSISSMPGIIKGFMGITT